MSPLDQHSLLKAELSRMTAALGFAAPAMPEPELAPVIKQVLADPVALQMLSDRVFKLLLQDLRRQQERSRRL